jgi:signal peptide peptidase SppA
MSRDFRHVLASIYNTPLAILPEKLKEIEAVVWARIRSGPTPAGQDKFDDAQEDTPVLAAREDDEPYQRAGDVAVIAIYGTITNRPTIFSSYSGGTSAEELGRTIDAAAADRTIRCILLDVDSPGGSVYGIEEAAAKILAARDRKPVTAVANPVAASAAYWLASQAGELVVVPSGQVGSVGVIAAHVDESEAEKLAGLKTTLITAGKYKGELDGSQPLTAEARAAVQDTVDQYYDKFVRAVAAGRKTSLKDVRENFGEGRMRTAADAVKAGMADRVATFEDVLQELQRDSRKDGGRTRAAAERAQREAAARLAEMGISTR